MGMSNREGSVLTENSPRLRSKNMKVSQTKAVGQKRVLETAFVPLTMAASYCVHESLPDQEVEWLE